MQLFKYTLVVFLGGGVGSLARWGISLLLEPYSQQFPAGTLAANLLSCFVVGMAVALTNHPLWGSPPMRLLLITGFCGGFSTFSTLMRESLQCLEANRLTTMLFYAMGSFILGLLALIGGTWVGNRLIH